VEPSKTARASSPEPLNAGGPDPRRWAILAVILVAQLMIVLDASIVIIALPSAQHALHISTANRQWVITAYTLAFGGFLLLGGRIADFSGRKRMFVVALLGFAGASALGGLAVDEAMLFAARALQGAFAALMAPAALSILTITFAHDAKERTRAFGAYGAVLGAGGAIGFLLGGALTEYASWRWCLLVNTPAAVLAFIAAVLIVHESRASGSTKYDVPGALLSTLGLVSLVYGFTRAESDGWGATITIVLLVAAAILLTPFVYRETKASHPLLPLRVARPEPGRRVPGLPAHQRRALRHVRLRDLLPAERAASQAGVVHGFAVAFAVGAGFLALEPRRSDTTFTCPSKTAGLASDSTALVVARLAQRIGAAAMLPAAISLVTTIFSEGTGRTQALGAMAQSGPTGARRGASRDRRCDRLPRRR